MPAVPSGPTGQAQRLAVLRGWEQRTQLSLADSKHAGYGYDVDGEPDEGDVEELQRSWNAEGGGGTPPYGWEAPENKGPIFPGAGEYLGPRCIRPEPRTRLSTISKFTVAMGTWIARMKPDDD